LAIRETVVSWDRYLLTEVRRTMKQTEDGIEFQVGRAIYQMMAPCKHLGSLGADAD
jgi:hypothetical protein